MTTAWVAIVCLAVSFVVALPADYARRRAASYASVAQIANVLALIGIVVGLGAAVGIHGGRIIAVIAAIVIGQVGADRFATSRWGRVGAPREELTRTTMES